MINFEKLKEVLLASSKVLISTHVNPDADAIGSEMAMYHLLTELGKDVHIVNFSSTPYNLEFLDPSGVIKHYCPESDELIKSADLFIAIDFNRSDRVVKMRDAVVNSKSVKICIDHHLMPEDFVDYQFIDDIYSSTGEIIFDFIKKTGIVKLNYNIAYNIYAAIMTDTGSFRFDRTTPELHRKIAELLEAGVSPTNVYDAVYDQSKFGKVKLLGRALSTLTLAAEGGVSYMVLYQNDFDETGGIESDTDGFVNFSLSIENVRVGLLFIELKDGFKVSFRSKGNIPVNTLAGEFGGGGHKNAAGARFFNRQLDENLNFILQKAEEYYYKYKD